MKPKRLNAIAPLLLCLLIPSTAMSAPAVKEVEVNGVVSDRRQWQWGCPIGLHRIDTREGVCSGVRRVHVGSLLRL